MGSPRKISLSAGQMCSQRHGPSGLPVTRRTPCRGQTYQWNQLLPRGGRSIGAASVASYAVWNAFHCADHSGCWIRCFSARDAGGVQ